MSSLRGFAYEHYGWYPKDGKTPLESLQIFYNRNPEYFGNGDLLAGISGDRDEVKKRLKLKRPTDETVSSWVYFQGFREEDGDGKLAIIWERQDGICFNGRFADGHAVGFSDGHHEQIPQARWPEFLKDQEKLRQAVLDQDSLKRDK